jgi:hypothetical protein
MPDYPNEVPIAFPNEISSQYRVLACENDPDAGNGRHAYKIVALAPDGSTDYETEIKFQKG